MLIKIEDLRTDGGTQPRGWLDDAVVRRYADDMEAGLWDFAKSSEPITAFHDGENYWLGDGFHRVNAAERAHINEVEVDVRQGSQRDAILFSVGASARHGFPRSNEDKRRAVLRLLDDAEWSKWADREIARRCSVTHPFVSKLRASLETVTSDQPERTYTTKHGTIASMKTDAIGGKSKAPGHPATPAVQPEVGSTETERDGVGDFTGLGQVQADDDAKLPAKRVEQEYDSGTQALLKRYLSQNDFPSIVRHPARRAAAAARMFAPKTFAKVRQRMERQRQWLTDFLAALDQES